MRALALLALTFSIPASAQVVTPVPSREDPRVQVVRLTANQPIGLGVTPGRDLTVILPTGERVSNVSSNNNTVYQVTVSDGFESFILHTSMVLFQGAPVTNGKITVTTDRRSYQFLLTPGAQQQPAYVLRLTYAGPDRAGTRSAKPVPQYKLTGNKALRPSTIRDDGSKTFIRWGDSQPIPAVFALNRVGQEEMVDGYMRAGTFTIDRVHDHLVFRIDDTKAEARRARETRR